MDGDGDGDGGSSISTHLLVVRSSAIAQEDDGTLLHSVLVLSQQVVDKLQCRDVVAVRSGHMRCTCMGSVEYIK